MPTDVSSIDELLLSGQPAEPAQEIEPEEAATAAKLPEFTPESDDKPSKPDKASEAKPLADVSEDDDHDEYGNVKPAAKTYSEEEVNERINKAVRERMSRGDRNNPAPDVRQPAKPEFEYNAESDESWQHQLESFVEQTVSKMSSKKEQQAQQARDQQAHQDFETKFHQGMDKFADFRDVVGAQNVTDAMTIATRSMKDPAAFLYAASKRHGAELQRIAQLPDQYAQMMEIGKLEERMKKGKVSTKAPAPVSRTKETGSMKIEGGNKEPTIEDLIAHSNAKRIASRIARRR